MHDYHIHSHFCRHATGRLEEYARSAVQRGLKEICFTPHVPFPVFRPGFFGNRLRMDLEEFPLYLEELRRVREEFPGLTILSGVEADYVEGTEKFIEGFLSSHAFDFVLMSVHFVRAWPDDQWVFDFSRDPRPLERIYDDYLAAVLSGIETGLFDCLAHLDLIKQEGRPMLASHRRPLEQIISAARARGMSAEINTSGLRKEIGESYPSDDIARLITAQGLPVVPGSDAHAPGQVGFGFESLAGTPLVRYRGRRIEGSPP